MALNTGSAGSRIRLILGETGANYLLILNEDNGRQTYHWEGMPNAICKQINNCITKGRYVKELDCNSTTGAWYVKGIKYDGTGAHCWWGSTTASISADDIQDGVKVSFGSQKNYYGDPKEMYTIIKGSNGYSCSNIPQGLQTCLKRINEKMGTINFVRLFDDGGYFISSSEGYQWNGISEYVGSEVKKSDGKVHDVAIARDDSWVVIRDNVFSLSHGVAKCLERELTSFYSRVKKSELERRLAREAAERERVEREAREERERLVREAAERARLMRETAERERIEREAREERERLVREAAERERIEREAREKRERLLREAEERKMMEMQKLVLQLQEECTEVTVLENLVKKRKQDIMLRIESLPQNRRVHVLEKHGWSNKTAPAKIDCVICHDGEAVQAIVPCGHHCLCDDCATTVMTRVPRTCPLCREVIQRTLKIYKSC